MVDEILFALAGFVGGAVSAYSVANVAIGEMRRKYRRRIEEARLDGGNRAYDFMLTLLEEKRKECFRKNYPEGAEACRRLAVNLHEHMGWRIR